MTLSQKQKYTLCFILRSHALNLLRAEGLKCEVDVVVKNERLNMQCSYGGREFCMSRPLVQLRDKPFSEVVQEFVDSAKYALEGL